MKRYDEEKVVQTYMSRPMTIAECTKINNLSNPTIMKILDRHEIQRYSKAMVFNPNLNEHYFDVIDTEAKAYFLGFLMADGNVHILKDGGRQMSISISQVTSRKYILQLFLIEIGIDDNRTISDTPDGMSEIGIRSNVMASTLMNKYGIVPNKSYKQLRLPMLEPALMKHLIRGLMDADGSVTSTITAQKKHKHAISFCGSQQLMYDIRLFLHMMLNTSLPTIYTYDNKVLSEIKYQSIDDCYTIGRWIYSDATIYLVDKLQNFMDFVGHYNMLIPR